jgi:hypothetical protein
MKKLIVKDENNTTIGEFSVNQPAPCALIVETFGTEVIWNGVPVWQNEKDGSAGESYDNFAEIIYKRITDINEYELMKINRRLALN